MNAKALINATVIGTLAQIAMVVIGHYVPAVKAQFMWGGLGLSLVAGLLYGRAAAQAWLGSALGGLVAGGVCALIGTVLSHLLTDIPAQVVLLGSASSAVTGALGGALGKLLAPKFD